MADTRSDLAKDLLPKPFLDQLGIPGDYRTSFEDEAGNPISYERFQAAMAKRPFDLEKDATGHRVTFKLENDAKIARQAAAKTKPKALAIQDHPFPTFHATTLDGAPVSTAALRGKPFLASFFFAQCGPCIAETPVLSAFHQAHPDMAVVAFTFDDPATARDFVITRKLNWTVVADQAELADRAGVKVYPTLMLVDEKGVVRKAVHTDDIAPAGKPLDLPSLSAWALSTH